MQLGSKQLPHSTALEHTLSACAWPQDVIDIVKSYQPAFTACSSQHNVVSRVVCTPDGQFAITSGWEGNLTMWHMATATCTGIFAGHQRQVHALAISPDGRLLVSSGDDNCIRSWDLGGSFACIQLYPMNSSRTCRSLAFSPDSSRLAMVTDSTSVWIINVLDGKLCDMLRVRNPAIGQAGYSVCWNPSATKVAVAGLDPPVYITELAVCHTSEPLNWHAGAVYSIGTERDMCMKMQRICMRV